MSRMLLLQTELPFLISTTTEQQTVRIEDRLIVNLSSGKIQRQICQKTQTVQEYDG